MENVKAVGLWLLIAAGLWWFWAHPGAGWERNGATLWPFDRVWHAGSVHPDRPHVLAAVEEDKWQAAPGYQFIDVTKNLDVAWTPGLRSSDNEKLRSSFREGMWLADPGYGFGPSNAQLVSDPSAPAMHWIAGARHPVCDFIESGAQEGHWFPTRGYHLAHPGVAGDFTVVSNTGRRIADPDWGGAVGSKVGEGVARGCAQDREGDGFLDWLGRRACQATADEFHDQANRALDRTITVSGPPIACDYWSMAWKRPPSL